MKKIKVTVWCDGATGLEVAQTYIVDTLREFDAIQSHNWRAPWVSWRRF